MDTPQRAALISLRLGETRQKCRLVPKQQVHIRFRVDVVVKPWCLNGNRNKRNQGSEGIISRGRHHDSMAASSSNTG